MPYKKLFNFASALVIGTSVAATGPAIAQPKNKEDGLSLERSITISEDLRKDILSIAQRMKDEALNGAHKGKDKVLTKDVLSLQSHMADYYKIFGHPAYLPPIKKDGKLNHATAEALIDVAKREDFEAVFVEVPSLEPEEATKMRFLRNSLEKIAPQPYFQALRSISEAQREELATLELNQCLSQGKSVSFTSQHLIDETNKLRADNSYISDVVPSHCVPALKELRLGSRASAQINLIFNLSMKTISKPEFCTRKELDEAGQPVCTQLKI